MDNINCSCKQDAIVETKNEINAQHDIRGVRPHIPCEIDRVAGARGIDSSLLFFFLILVCIVCQCDIDIDMDTLLWFFLLLVVIYQYYI